MKNKLQNTLLILLMLGSLALAENMQWLNRESKTGAAAAYSYYKNNYLQNKNANTAWQFARAAHYYGYNFITEYPEQYRIFSEGIEAAKYSIQQNPNNPAPHFWHASCAGSIVDASGLLEGWKYVGEILTALNTSIKLEPAFMDGAAYAVRAKVYYKAPSWPLSIGDEQKAEADFAQAFRYGTNKNRLIYRFYAEYLLHKGKLAEAKTIIAQGLAIPLDKLNIVEDQKEIDILKKLYPSN